MHGPICRGCRVWLKLKLHCSPQTNLAQFHPVPPLKKIIHDESGHSEALEFPETPESWLRWTIAHDFVPWIQRSSHRFHLARRRNCRVLFIDWFVSDQRRRVFSPMRSLHCIYNYEIGQHCQDDSGRSCPTHGRSSHTSLNFRKRIHLRTMRISSSAAHLHNGAHPSPQDFAEERFRLLSSTSVNVSQFWWYLNQF
jgi:hypothetical protein